MADPTKYTAMTSAKLGNPDNPIIYVDRQVSDTGTSVEITSPGFVDKDGTALATGGFVVVTYLGGDYDGYTEKMKVTGVSSDKLTLTVVRGMPPSGMSIDVADADADLAKIIPKGSIVEIAPVCQQQEMTDAVMAGTIPTGANDFKVGDGTAVEQGFSASQGLANDSKYAFDASGNPVIYLADGSSFTPGAGAGSISGGDGIDVTASVISVDLGTDSGLEFVSNKLEAKVTGAVSKGASGLDVDESNLDYSSSAENIAGTATNKPVNVAGVVEVMENNTPTLSYEVLEDITTVPAPVCLIESTTAASVLDESQTGTNLSIGGTTGYQYGGAQTFTVPDFIDKITGFSIPLKRSADTTGTLTMRLLRGDDPNTATELHSETINVSSLGTSYADFSATMTEEDVTPGETLCITLVGDGNTGAFSYWEYRSASGSYPGGELWQKPSTGAYVEQASSDASFEILGYISSTGVGLTDANDSDRLKFLGFITETASRGDTKNISYLQKISGFTGLDNSYPAKYYISDTKGDIGTSAGTNSIECGKAINDTDLIILH